MALVKMNFLSESLAMQVNLTVVLPTYSFADAAGGQAAYYVPGMKFQTLWLLHGAFGDDSDWVNFTSLVRYADANKLAVVMGAGCNSSYVDMAHGGRFFTYFTEELPRVCRCLFPLSERREDNFVAGLSMGGNGAMRLAVKRPDLYAGAVCLSGAAPSYEGVLERTRGRAFGGPFRMPTQQEIYGDLDAFPGGQEDVYALAARNAEKGQPLPSFWFGCGTEDFALKGVRSAAEHLSSLGYPVHAEEVPGYAHEWDFWDLYIRKAIYELLPLKRKPLVP